MGRWRDTTPRQPEPIRLHRPGGGRLTQNGAMDTDLAPVVATPADLTDDELRALIATANDGPQFLPASWLGLSTSQVGRSTAGGDQASPCNPEAAVNLSEDAASLTAATMMQALFVQDRGPMTTLSGTRAA